jgi:hypothetical protein|tara:strand:- start:620 stop:892 length:273 start_codon:yes stop_codon:yes gene_type:complete
MVYEERCEKHGTQQTYVVRTYDSDTDWITTTRKDKIYVLSGYGWNIQYEEDDYSNRLNVGSNFWLPEKTTYRVINKDNTSDRLVLKVEFI